VEVRGEGQGTERVCVIDEEGFQSDDSEYHVVFGVEESGRWKSRNQHKSYGECVV